MSFVKNPLFHLFATAARIANKQILFHVSHSQTHLALEVVTFTEAPHITRLDKITKSQQNFFTYYMKLHLLVAMPCSPSSAAMLQHFRTDFQHTHIGFPNLTEINGSCTCFPSSQALSIRTTDILFLKALIKKNITGRRERLYMLSFFFFF